MYVLGWAQWQDDIGGGGAKAEEEEEGGKFRLNYQSKTYCLWLMCDKLTSVTVFAPKASLQRAAAARGKAEDRGGEKKSDCLSVSFVHQLACGWTSFSYKISQ